MPHTTRAIGDDPVDGSVPEDPGYDPPDGLPPVPPLDEPDPVPAPLPTTVVDVVDDVVEELDVVAPTASVVVVTPGSGGRVVVVTPGTELDVVVVDPATDVVVVDPDTVVVVVDPGAVVVVVVVSTTGAPTDHEMPPGSDGVATKVIWTFQYLLIGIDVAVPPPGLQASPTLYTPTGNNDVAVGPR